MPLVHARPAMDQATEQPQKKRPKHQASVPAQNESQKKTASSTVKTGKQKRSEKVDQKNNKGLIGASMMLSVVGMLNYMGNQEIPICTSLDE